MPIHWMIQEPPQIQDRKLRYPYSGSFSFPKSPISCTPLSLSQSALSSLWRICSPIWRRTAISWPSSWGFPLFPPGIFISSLPIPVFTPELLTASSLFTVSSSFESASTLGSIISKIGRTPDGNLTLTAGLAAATGIADFVETVEPEFTPDFVELSTFSSFLELVGAFCAI